MRLDLFLQRSCIIKRRSQAKAFCEVGAVRVNGAVAKPARSVKVGDTIGVEFWNRRVEITVTKCEERARRRGSAVDVAYELLREERKASVFEESIPDGSATSE